MSSWPIVMLLTTLMAPSDTEPALGCAEPGAAAPGAYALLDTEAETVACTAFIENIEEGTDNPWDYQGTALCAVDKPEIRARLLAALERRSVEAPLAHFARGYLSLREEDFGQARALLLRAIEHAPRLAPALNALGVVARKQEQPATAISRFERALESCPDLDFVKHNLAEAHETYSERIRATDLEQALLGFQTSYKLFKEIEEWREVAESSYNIGITLREMGKLDKALTTFGKTQFLLKMIDLHVARRGNYNQSFKKAIPPMLINETDSAFFPPISFHSPLYHNQWLRARNSSPFALGAGIPLPRWGMGPPTYTSLRYDGKSYKIPESELGFGFFSIQPGYVIVQEGDILFMQGKYMKSLITYRSAKYISLRPRLQGHVLAGEAKVLHIMGEYEDALWSYRKARDLYTKTGDVVQQGHMWNGEGHVFLALQEAELALEAFQTSHEIFKQTEAMIGRGNAWQGKALAMLRFADYPSALAGFRESRRHFASGGSLTGQGATWVGEAEALLRGGDREGASSAFQEARRLFEEAGDQLELTNAILNEASLLMWDGFNQEAAEAAARSIPFLRQQKLMPYLLRALLLEVEARRRLGEADLAAELAREVIEIHSNHRKGFVTEEQRSRIDLSITPAYDLLISQSFEDQDFDNAMAWSEKSRSRVLLDLMTANPLERVDDSPESAEEVWRIRARLAQVGTELRATSTLDRRRDLLLTRRALDRDLQQNLYRRISSAHRDFLGGVVKLAETLEAEEIRAIAREAGPIIYFHVTEDALLVFLAGSPARALISHQVPITRKELTETIDRFLYDLCNQLRKGSSRDQAEALWQALIEPFLEHLPPSGPLTIVPHGPLHGLPFEALVEPATGAWLFSRWDVSVTPSMSVLDIARRKRHRASLPRDTLVVFSAGAGSMLATEDLRRIAQLFPDPQQKIFDPSQAEFGFYEQNAPEARHLLIATMGIYSRGSRRGTYLEILPTPGVHDERLSAAELATIRLHAELVTLAACDTDRGEAPLSDERVTLTRSFLIAGASSVLATRWRIPNEQSTMRFLVDFYQTYRTPSNRKEKRKQIAFTAARRKDEALTLARHRAIERGEPPQVWAAWVLVGDPR